MRRGLRFALMMAVGVTLPASVALADAPVVVSPVLSTGQTASGQPIVLPAHDVRLIVTRFVIQPGATLPVHEHPYQRYAYVLSGQLDVTMSDTGQVFHYGPGDFIVEVRGQWHYGTAVGAVPVVLLVIDQVEAGHGNTILMGTGQDAAPDSGQTH